jgi:hypothetical protein
MIKVSKVLIILVVLIFLVSIGIAQASPSNQSATSSGAGVSSVYPLNRWKSDYIYTNGDVGTNVDIALDPDHADTPWVSFFNATYGSLWVSHYVGATGGNCGPSSTWYCEQVDQVHAQTKGWFTSIDVHPDTNPNPIITDWSVGVSYYDYSNNSLKYAELHCPLIEPCSWTIYTVDSGGVGDTVGYYTSLKFDQNGNPHIAYYAQYAGDPFSSYQVKYAYFAGGGTGNCGDNNNWHCEYVDASIFRIGEYPSLDIDWSGNVYIGYYDGFNQSLKYAYYGGIGSCGTGDAWICITLDDPSAADVGLFLSLHAPQNSSDDLKIAYYDTTNGRLKYATGPRLSGNCGPSNSFACFYIDDMGAGLPWASISIDVDKNNHAMIAYTDAEEDLAPLGLKVTGPSTVPPWDTCDGTLPDWQCARVDNGDQYLDAGKYVALAIKDSGLAVIAYSETNTYDYPVTNDLKFTTQTMWSFLPLTKK